MRKTILVVDDEPVITKTLVLILNNFDHEFLAIGCTTVQDALTTLRAIRLDLVLLDAILPGIQGLQHAVEMRDQCGCKVLMMSGQGATADLLAELVNDGHAGFEILAKPFPPEDLIRKIRETFESGRSQHMPQLASDAPRGDA